MATRRTRWRALAAVAPVVLGAFVVASCQQGIPKEALQLSPESLEDRQLQTRRFDTEDEAMLLSASAGVLQDLGFTLDESETNVGLIVASKDRDASEAGQYVASFLMVLLTGVATPVDRNQKIRVSLVTRPTGKSTNVRVTFQRIVWNTKGQVSREETLGDANLYQEFFSKLSKAVFLEANHI